MTQISRPVWMASCRLLSMGAYNCSFCLQISGLGNRNFEALIRFQISKYLKLDLWKFRDVPYVDSQGKYLVFKKFLVHQFMLGLAKGKLGTGLLDTEQVGRKLYHYVFGIIH